MDATDDDRPLVCLLTFPDDDTARRIARALVEERLVACVNLAAGLRSIYAWKGTIADDAEVLGLCKTTARRFESLCTRVAALHPYEVPEVIALPIEGGHAPYLAWLRESVKP